MRTLLIASSLFFCLGLTSSDNTGNDYEKYSSLIKDMPSAKVLIDQNKALDISLKELERIEVKLDSTQVQ